MPLLMAILVDLSPAGRTIGTTSSTREPLSATGPHNAPPEVLRHSPVIGLLDYFSVS